MQNRRAGMQNCVDLRQVCVGPRTSTMRSAAAAAVLLGLAGAATVSSGSPPPTKLALPSVLADDAVLPAAGATLWGWAKPGSKIAVALAGAHAGSYPATADATHGSWEVALPAVAPSLALSTVTISTGAEKLTLQRVLFGELILCGGQVRPLIEAASAAGAAAAAAPELTPLCLPFVGRSQICSSR